MHALNAILTQEMLTKTMSMGDECAGDQTNQSFERRR